MFQVANPQGTDLLITGLKSCQVNSLVFPLFPFLDRNGVNMLSLVALRESYCGCTFHSLWKGDHYVGLPSGL